MSNPARAAEKAALSQEKARRCAVRELRLLRRSGDLPGVLAALDRLPASLRESSEILLEESAALAELNEFEAAEEPLDTLFARNPVDVETWARAGLLLSARHRSDEVPVFVERMLEALPGEPHVLLRAAAVAGRGGHHDLADGLVDEALSPRFEASAATTLAAARILLKLGQHGRVVAFLDERSSLFEESFRDEAADVRSRVLEELRLARGSETVAAEVRATDRAATIAVESILAGARPRAAPAGGGIAIVLPALGPGGAQKQTLHLIRGLCSRRQLGPIVLLLTSETRRHPEFFSDDVAGLDIVVERIVDFSIELEDVVPEVLAGQVRAVANRIASPVAFLVDRLSTHRPDVVLVMSYVDGVEAALAAAIASVPRVVVSARGDVPVAGTRRDYFANATYEVALARESISLVTNSSTTARAFSERLGTARVAGIPNGVDVDGLRSSWDPAATAAHRRSLGIPDGVPVVGSVYNFRKEKRPQLWVKSAAILAARLPDARFVIVGGGFDSPEAAGLVTSEELDRRLHRPGVQRDVVNWVKMMDVVLLTSATEGTPNALLEAQALGKPVVATAVGGNAETFLPGETGILLSRDPTPEEVAAAVTEILGDPGYRARARDLGPAFIRERFGIDRMVDELVGVCFPEPRHADEKRLLSTRA